MTLNELKSHIENGIEPDGLYIFKYDDTDFVPNQYIKEIIRGSGGVQYYDSISDILNETQSLFYTPTPKTRVCRIEKFDCIDPSLTGIDGKNIIVCKNIDESSAELFSDNIFDFGKLDKWQIADFLYSNAQGVERKKLDWLLQISNYDPYRLENEIDKLSLFSDYSKRKVFDEFVDNGVFDDMCQYNVLNLVNAITNRDAEEVCKIYKNISKMNIDYMGLVSLLLQNFKKIASVWMTNNPTEQNTGLKSNQIWAISKLPRKYSRENLTDIIQMLCKIDGKIKSGDMPSEKVIDYTILKIMSI